ncbi:MAG: bifunctional diaminohydroxyphosphoribosylaminopyrimidine deaminase/5-amino-6-(5-phosphoribosylamino)uracil reductase RibD [Desulfovibrionaceae bacterium]|nr:bifunctional diaminohydroxyphosphoribosylaminopyrimidine deaminase/5-amino-6-(5-phosphoribosylamino)uracil reductase RibD [Desulfovibrionaceae bacterium]
MKSLIAEQAMRRAVRLAQQGLPAVSPNPAVGAVLLQDGKVVAEGRHEYFGGPHAEVNCLADAARRGIDPKNCSMLVTLEPCSHHGKTPPCTEAVLQAGVPELLVGCADPTPKAKGGAELLRQHGVRVEMGVLEAECRGLISDFLHWQTSELPFVSLKMAATLDGFIATRAGKSRWISGPSARQRVHWLRATSHAVLIGGGTLRADDPLLNVRFDEFVLEGCPSEMKTDILPAVPGLQGRDDAAWLNPEPLQNIIQPRAVVLSSRALDPKALPRLLRERGKSLIIVTESSSPLAGQRNLLEEWGAALLCIDAPAGSFGRGASALSGSSGICFSSEILREVLVRLRSEFCLHRILCEGGGQLGLSLLRGGLVQEFELHQAPLLMADRNAVNLFDGLTPQEVSDGLHLHLLQVACLGGDIISKYKPGE